MDLDTQEYERLLSALPGFVQIYDLQARQFLYNSLQQTYLGYDTADVVAQGVTFITAHAHRDDVERISAYLDELHHLRADMHHTLHYRMRDKQGMWRWVESDSSVFERAKDGSPMKIIMTSRDVTDQFRPDAIELPQLTNHFDALFEHTRLGVTITDLDGNLLRSNRNLAVITGYSVEELEGMNFRQFTHPDDLTVEVLELDKILSGEQPSYLIKKRYIQKNGNVLWVEVNCSLIRDHQGNVRHILALVEDIDAQQKVHASLDTYRTHMRTLLDSTPQAFALFDTNGTLLIYNRATSKFLKIFDRRAEIGISFFDLTPNEESHRAFQDALGGHSIKLKRERNDRSYEFTYNPAYNEQGQLCGVSVTGYDMTTVQLATKREMELLLEKERIRLITDFILNVSHEFRTPLAVIGTSLHLLRRRVSTENPDILRHMESIEQQSSQILRLTEGMLTMSRLDSGLALKFAHINVGDVLDHVVGNMLKRAQQREITINTSYQNGRALVRGDDEYLEIAFTEIIDNAIKFAPENGQVTVSRIQDHASVEITIRDNGMGMDEETRKHMFDRFYRGDKAQTLRGVGIGASIARKIINDHHGTIKAISAQGGGTTVIIKLPVAK